jgi:hypothetical protein
VCYSLAEEGMKEMEGLEGITAVGREGGASIPVLPTIHETSFPGVIIFSLN